MTSLSRRPRMYNVTTMYYTIIIIYNRSIYYTINFTKQLKIMSDVAVSLYIRLIYFASCFRAKLY